MFPDEKKKIYQYRDGEKEVFADPMVVLRRFLQGTAGDPDPLLAEAHQLVVEAFKRQGDPEFKLPPAVRIAAVLAQEKLAAASRFAFAMKAFDPATGRGVVDEDALNCLYDFLGYCESLKKKGAPSPTSSTATPDSPSPSPTTRPNSPSGS